MYARTIIIPAGTKLTGALIKIATILIASGDFTAFIGDDVVAKSGYHIFAADAYRKQAFLAKTDTYLTMVFPTNLESIYDIENQFTDEGSMLSSRKEGAINDFLVTGE
jgi:hypothetical protein